MRRPATTWLLLALGLLVTFGGLAWVTFAALDLDRAEIEARGRADREESIRLALWRMDSAIAPIVAAEGARPYFHYWAFYPADRAYTRMYQKLRPGEVQIASPLLVQRSPSIRLHFQVGSDGALTSPQVPVSNMLDLAESTYVAPGVVDEMAGRLARLSGIVGGLDVLCSRIAPAEDAIQIVPVPNVPRAGPPQGRGSQELQARRIFTQNAGMETGRQAESYTPGDVRVDALVPLRLKEEMLLARRVSVGEETLVQGVWLDGPVLRRDLLAQVADLLPGAALTLVDMASGDDDPRRLASLPLRLVPGPAAEPEGKSLTPIRIALLMAWAAAIFGAVGLATLLRSAVRLGERRAAFVSAVTHELRTPLTTFRMYTELLASDMVGAEKRGKYLDTLQRESDRLGHLVENVLAYAGLERGRNGGETEDLDLGEILERQRPTLTETAERAGMRLEFAVPEELPRIRADRSAIERIVRNLVDNACKYAHGAENDRIHVVVDARAGSLVLSVTDHGPGIPAREAAGIFRPFRKSATQAAHSAPGVGLGLALCRALARAMSGDLRLVATKDPGARFTLTLPTKDGTGRN